MESSKSKAHASSSSSQSRETSPIEMSKKHANKAVRSDVSRTIKKLHTGSSTNQKTSETRSHSPSSRDERSLKLAKSVKKSDELDVSKVVKKHHSKNIYDQKNSKSQSDQRDKRSKSQSPASSRSSHSKERSPILLSKDISLPDTPKIVATKNYTSRSDKKASKSRSSSPTSNKSRERSPVKLSKDAKKPAVSGYPKTVSRNRTDSSSDRKSSKSRSRSPSTSQSRERSPLKQSKAVSGISGNVRKNRTDSSPDQKSSKSRSRSPSSSRSQERGPLKLCKDVKPSIVSSTSRPESRTDNSSDQETSKSNSRSSSRGKSQERRSVKRSKIEEKVEEKHWKSSKSRSRSLSSNRSSQSEEKSPVKLSKMEESLISDDSRAQRKNQRKSSLVQNTSKSRSRSSSSSPPPHQALECFSSPDEKKSHIMLSKSKKTDALGNAKKDYKGSSENNPGTVDQKTNLSSDPPRKKLKINRNNVQISSFESSGNVSKSLNENISKVPVSPPIDGKESESNSNQFETVEREMGEIIENSPEVKYEPRKINFPGRKLSRKSSEDLSTSEPKSKKSKWGKFASSQKSSQTINISTDSLKNWFPEFKLVNEPPVVNDSIPENSPIKEDKKLSFPLKIEEETTQQSSPNGRHIKNKGIGLETNESSGPVSKIVFIRNLVRPFTLLQLKELLRQTGSFIEEDFWIDKIKSKCFVTYATEEEAIKTRNALNGVRWPSSNPKILSAEFSTEEEFEYHRSGKDALKPVPERLPEVQETIEEKAALSTNDHRRKERDTDKRKERERYRPQAPVREWDKDKILQDSPDREKGDKNIEGYRGADRKDKKDTKKRVNEDTPAKLLDDLFQKTKSVPCIYWLPLTDAQVLEHEESKRLRRLEREKRNQQREKEEAEQRSKRSRLDHKSREMESRRSSTRSRSPTSRRR